MPMPRLLPLVAIAAGGVLVINMIENGPGIIGAARSFAEGVNNHAPATNAASAVAAAVDANASALPDPNAPPAKPAPICAESPEQIAKDAGLTPAELQVIQSLQSRRGDLDAREQGLSTELALIQAAEAKVDAKIATMNALKGDMQTMLGQLDQKQQDEVNRLVKVYEAMKPKDAAARFTLLSDAVRLPIAAAMKEKSLSAILANMSPPDAKVLTELLAARFLAQANAVRQAVNTPTAQPSPGAAPPAAAPPAPQQTAQAAPPATPAPAAPAPAHHTPHRRPHPPARHPSTPALASNAPAGAPAPTHAASTPAPASAATPTPAAPPTHG
jgi:flagellar motility protein MotE (MotC chaperone)